VGKNFRQGLEHTHLIGSPGATARENQRIHQFAWLVMGVGSSLYSDQWFDKDVDHDSCPLAVCCRDLYCCFCALSAAHYACPCAAVRVAVVVVAGLAMPSGRLVSAGFLLWRGVGSLPAFPCAPRNTR